MGNLKFLFLTSAVKSVNYIRWCHLPLTYTHFPIHFKSLRDYSQYLIQYKCRTHSCCAMLMGMGTRKKNLYMCSDGAMFKNIFNPFFVESADGNPWMQRTNYSVCHLCNKRRTICVSLSLQMYTASLRDKRSNPGCQEREWGTVRVEGGEVFPLQPVCSWVFKQVK